MGKPGAVGLKTKDHGPISILHSVKRANELKTVIGASFRSTCKVTSNSASAHVIYWGKICS